MTKEHADVADEIEGKIRMRDAVTEINIENPTAKEAFVRWWRTMEAQGYQYGFEALCNVWVGFDDGRRALAKELLSAMEKEWRYDYAITAFHTKCKELGVEVEKGNL